MKGKLTEIWKEADSEWQHPVLGKSIGILIVAISAAISAVATEYTMREIVGAQEWIQVIVTITAIATTVVLVYYVLKKIGF